MRNSCSSGHPAALVGLGGPDTIAGFAIRPVGADTGGPGVAPRANTGSAGGLEEAPGQGRGRLRGTAARLEHGDRQAAPVSDEPAHELVLPRRDHAGLTV